MLISPPASAEQLVRPSDDAARAQAQARLEAFNQNLLAHPSATAVLQQWCDAQGQGPAPRITARRVPGVHKEAGPEIRSQLGVEAAEPLSYRRVELICGDRVLSQADNWYRPGRLTTEMNRQLEETETPFGVVAGALRFTRRNLSAVLLFKPAEGQGPLVVPPQILRQSARLETPDGQPLALVVETYTAEVLKGREP